MLVIEGSDELGKTSLAKSLVETADSDGLYPVYYAHMGKPPKCFDFLYDYIDRMSFFAVQDRFHLGSIVWHSGVMTNRTMAFIEAKLGSFGSLTVVLYHSDDEQYSKMLKASREDQLFDDTYLMRANKMYMSMDHSCNVDFFYDVAKGYPNNDTEFMNKLLAEWYKRLNIAGCKPRWSAAISD